jgi:hypothetical protein
VHILRQQIPHFYVLGFGMEHWVLCNTYGTGAIRLKWDMSIFLTKVTHGIVQKKVTHGVCESKEAQSNN